MRKLIGLSVLCLCVLLTGCETKQAPFLSEPNYSNVLVMPDFEISFTGTIKVETGADGVISVYNNGSQKSSSGIKVSGKGKFRVHGVGSVFVAGNVVADCYDCSDVSADNGTTVNAYQCGTVKANPEAKVNAYGSTIVHKAPTPK